MKNIRKEIKKYDTAYEAKKILIAEEIIKLFNNKKLTALALSKKISYSTKQCRRLIKQFKNNEFNFEHKNKNKPSNRKISEKVEKEIIEMYDSYVKNINIFRNIDFEKINIEEVNNKKTVVYFVPHKYFYYELNIKQKFNISYSFLSKLLTENNRITNLTKRKTKRKLRRKIKEENNDNSINEYYRKLIFNDSLKMSFIEYNKTKEKPYCRKQYDFGQVVEIDACQHRWMDENKFYIYHAIDAGSKKLLAFHIEKEETNNGYAILLNDLFKKYGAPITIRTDRRTTFWNKDSTTNLAYCLEKLNIKLETNSDPTFKPNVEGSFNLAQTFYPLIFFKLKINTVEKMIQNKEQIIDTYNSKFEKKDREFNNQFLKLKSKEISDSLYCRIERKMHKGFYVFYENKNYCIVDNNGKRKLAKTSSIIIRKNLLNNQLTTVFDNRTYKLEIINDQQIDEFIDASQKDEIAKWEKEKKFVKAQTRKIRESLERKHNIVDSKINELNKLIDEVTKKKIMLDIQQNNK